MVEGTKKRNRVFDYFCEEERERFVDEVKKAGARRPKSKC